MVVMKTDVSHTPLITLPLPLISICCNLGLIIFLLLAIQQMAKHMILMMMYMVRMMVMVEMVMMLVKVCLFEGDLAANLLMIGSSIQDPRSCDRCRFYFFSKRFHSDSKYSNLSTKLLKLFETDITPPFVMLSWYQLVDQF